VAKQDTRARRTRRLASSGSAQTTLATIAGDEVVEAPDGDDAPAAGAVTDDVATDDGATDEAPPAIEIVETRHDADDDVEEANPDDPPWARRVPRGGKFGRLGQTMVDRGLNTAEQLDDALTLQRSSGRRVGETLVEIGAITHADLTQVLAEHLGVAYVDLKARPPDPMLAPVLPEEIARRYKAVVVARWQGQIVIAMANPNDLFALDDLHLVMRDSLIPVMADEEDLAAAINRVYQASTVETTVDAASNDYDDEALDELSGSDIHEATDGPVVRLVNALLEQAVADRASDLHVEPNSQNVAIRFRIDGVLHDTSEVPLTVLRALVSRLKILGDLDIAQQRHSQDGRFSLKVQGRPVDVRVVTVPTACGEAVVLRLLDPIRDALDVSSLSMTPEEEARFLPAFNAPQGAVFITGPTGSGKTSTVYAVLGQINSRTKSIVSVEDPVEYRLDGIKQIQINPRADVRFPNTLRSILRADPDVVFIGEVRDRETAQIAADASITGHLVLSTVHTNSAAATPMRLIDMGVEPYLVASSLTLVASQRLARRLCDACAVPDDNPDLNVLRRFGADDALLEGATIHRAVGCPVCRNTGYRGRVPIFEIMPITEGLSRMIVDSASSADIEHRAVVEGMETIRVAAIRRVTAGALSLDEMTRVIA
jgi:type IV pilus assembly protein PilB